LFLIGATAYLSALLVIHLLVPRLQEAGSLPEANVR
jgi:hypothetical protein